MYYVYILRCLRTNELYKGSTNNINRRLEEHQLGKVNSTRYKRPMVLVHVEVCSNYIAARNLELYFKSGVGRGVLKEMLGY